MDVGGGCGFFEFSGREQDGIEALAAKLIRCGGVAATGEEKDERDLCEAFYCARLALGS